MRTTALDRELGRAGGAMNPDPTWPKRRLGGMPVDYTPIRGCAVIRCHGGYMAVRVKKETGRNVWSLDVTNGRGEYILPEDVGRSAPWDPGDFSLGTAREDAGGAAGLEDALYLPYVLEPCLPNHLCYRSPREVAS